MDGGHTWRSLYQQHFDDVYRLARSLGVCSADVEDIAQRVFIVVHDKLKKEPGLVIEHPRAWLRAITVRVTADYRRWHLVRRMKRWLVRASSQEAAAGPDPEAAVASGEAQRLVREVLDRMSPKLREVLVLLEVEGLSPGEVAELLGIPANTVRSRKRLAREQFLELWRLHVADHPGVGVRAAEGGVR